MWFWRSKNWGRVEEGGGVVSEIPKEAQKDAKSIHRIVSLRMRLLDWMTHQGKKAEVLERTREEEIKSYGLRESVASAYNEQERQVYWKFFYDELKRLEGE